jgi:hypothetical protein
MGCSNDKETALFGQIINFIWSHFEKDLENTAEIVQRHGSQLYVAPNANSVQIAKGRNLGIPRSPAHLIALLQQKFWPGKSRLARIYQ